MCVTGQEQHLTQLEEGEGFLQDHPGVSELTAGEGAPQCPDRSWGECALRLMDWCVELTARGRGAEGQGPRVTVRTDASSRVCSPGTPGDSLGSSSSATSHNQPINTFPAM